LNLVDLSETLFGHHALGVNEEPDIRIYRQRGVTENYGSMPARNAFSPALAKLFTFMPPELTNTISS